MISHCHFCEKNLRNGDALVLARAGSMCWGDLDPTALYAEPLQDSPLCVYHVDCFDDGPVHMEESIGDSPICVGDVLEPICTVCRESLDVGELVYYFQTGDIINGGFDLDHFHRVSDGDVKLPIVTLYTHVHCVCVGAQALLPDIPEYIRSWEEEGIPIY